MAGEIRHSHKEAWFPKSSNDVEERAERARNEEMSITARVSDGEATGKYDVEKASGSSYVVSVNDDDADCTCADNRFNLGDDEKCKHARRVALALSFGNLAEPGEEISLLG
jgi:hypothetical protein